MSKFQHIVVTIFIMLNMYMLYQCTKEVIETQPIMIKTYVYEEQQYFPNDFYVYINNANSMEFHTSKFCDLLKPSHTTLLSSDALKLYLIKCDCDSHILDSFTYMGLEIKKER